ncbi:MAG: type II toxin-antitoxin system VapC family toxin [Methylococcales bacterium]|jgi:predicted nucleic acid-binding protein|nr:type II toxin-antitoxin system VapC family toxin [Methylococcales bacterium]MBT7409939.1 type II toxin-antitoxin system VapC family toxin [Methylococcales bacterium]
MLLDSNIFIYAVQPEYKSLREWCITQKICASNITRLEVLGYKKLAKKDKNDFFRLFEKTKIYPVSSVVIERAILLRQQKSISIGDSIIAATALEYNQILVTRNISDFEWIDELKVINPIAEKI